MEGGVRILKWNYYGVKIIKQIVVEGEAISERVDENFAEDADQIFEESVLLVHAQSVAHAYKIAKKKSSELDEPYKNQYGQQVIWRFVEAVDCYLIGTQVRSGTEVYSCFHRTDSNSTTKEFIEKWFRNDDDGV